MTAEPFLAQRERFARVGSTNDVVRAWLEAGTPEVCLAVADEQTAGRGREGRAWAAPAGAGLLLSVGFRPDWLAPEHVWRLAAIVALAMADASESVAGLAPGSIRLKWPNDLVIEAWAGGAAAQPSPRPARALPDPQQAGPVAQRQAARPSRDTGNGILKLAGLLGETTGLGTDDPRAIVGIGVNTDWASSEFPPVLAPAMTSLRELAGERPIDNEVLLEAFVGRLAERTRTVRAGRFDAAGWVVRQLTNGRPVRLDAPDGSSTVVRALGVDPTSGALVVGDRTSDTGQRTVLSGEIVHLRLADGEAADPAPVGV